MVAKKTSDAVATMLTSGEDWDWKGYVAGKRFALDRKFEAADVAGDALLLACAKMYVDSDLPEKISHTGIKQFVMDVKFKSRKWGLSAGQAKGLLNVAVGQITAVAGQQEAESKPFNGEPVVPNGTYTIVNNGDMEDYVTLRLKDDWRDDAPLGSQVAQFLSGPDNTTSFTGFAFVQGDVVKVWSRFKSESRIADALNFLIENGTDEEALGQARETYAVKSGRCSNCGKKLTVSVSLHRGLGSDCAKRLGMI